MPNLSPEAATLVRRCLSVEPESRPTIEEVLADPYFIDAPEEMPSLNPEEQSLRTFINDLIKRANVHEFNGRDAFETLFTQEVRDKSTLAP